MPTRGYRFAWLCVHPLYQPWNIKVWFWGFIVKPSSFVIRATRRLLPVEGGASLHMRGRLSIYYQTQAFHFWAVTNSTPEPERWQRVKYSRLLSCVAWRWSPKSEQTARAFPACWNCNCKSHKIMWRKSLDVWLQAATALRVVAPLRQSFRIRLVCKSTQFIQRLGFQSRRQVRNSY